MRIVNLIILSLSIIELGCLSFTLAFCMKLGRQFHIYLLKMRNDVCFIVISNCVVIASFYMTNVCLNVVHSCKLKL